MSMKNMLIFMALLCRVSGIYGRFSDGRECCPNLQFGQPSTFVEIASGTTGNCNHQPSKPLSKQKMQVTSLKNDCNLFSRLYIACQTRLGDLETFFMHENQAAPPSLPLGGKLRIGTKADLLDCLGLEGIQSTGTPAVDTKLLDGTAVVQMLNPGTARTFQEYSDQVFLSYVSNHLTTTKRVDIVWDVSVLPRIF